MTFDTIIAFFSAIFGLSTLIVALRALYSIQTVHVLMNSRLDELLKLTEKAAFKAGQKDQKDNPET